MPRPSTYTRRIEITLEGDRRQEQVMASIAARGFQFDWPAILSAAGESSDPLATIERAISDQLRGDDFGETVTALNTSGQFIAALIQKKYEEAAGVRKPAPIFPQAFAEPDLSKPEKAASFWSRILGITDEEAARLLARIASQQRERDAMAARVRESAMNRIQEIFSKHVLTGADINRGDSVQDFIQAAREIMPDATRANLETEYRTRLAGEYGTARQEQIAARSNVFPFVQFMAIKDGRTTWWICLPMGIAGPNKRGYICSSTDILVAIWQGPNHWRCRSTWSPISYLEAQRIGILASDGRTKIAVRGNDPNRPFGDPPQFATEPGGSKIRRVEPQEGFR